jgi:hypothetical protein
MRVNPPTPAGRVIEPRVKRKRRPVSKGAGERGFGQVVDQHSEKAGAAEAGALLLLSMRPRKVVRT